MPKRKDEKKQNKQDNTAPVKDSAKEEKMKGAVAAVKNSVKREKPVKQKKKEEKIVKPAPPKPWPKGPLTTQQKIYLYGGLFFRAMGPFLLYALMPSLCLALGFFLGGYNKEEGMTFEQFFSYGSNFYTTVGTFLTLWILAKRAKRRGSTIWEESTLFVKEMKPFKAIGFLIFGYASATAVSALVTLLPDFSLTESYTKATESLYLDWDLFFKLATLLLLAPVVEEIIFRGHMLNTFLEHIPEEKSVFLSSLIFAVLHMNPIWILYAFALGMILAKTSMKEDNIAYGVMLHIGFNATSVVNYFIQKMGLYDTYYGSKWLILVYGILGTLISLFLAAVYTNRLDLKMLWRRISGR